MKNKKRKQRILSIFLCGILLLVIGVIWYAEDYYHSDDSVNQYLSDTEKVKVIEFTDGFFFDGIGEETAFIFYPGAKVEYTAYAPLLHKLAEQGIDCFLVHMPWNLAIFGQNKADHILNSYSYKRWYIGGHSLGGAMAASYVSKNLEQWNGIILFGAYPIESLIREDFSVLSLYGSEDKVINLKKLEAGRKFMPKNYTELCIEGGNHAGFGNYGEQKGDGIASISREEQQIQAVEAIIKMIKESPYS